MSDYKFKFARVGGVTRVYIDSEEDIRHLGELDKKMWTVLSCPVKGLEIDEQTLKYMDSNADGSIRVDEVVAVSQWLSKVLTDLKPVVAGKDSLPLAAINQQDEEGKKLYDAAVGILKQVGKEGETEISLADSSSSLDCFRKAKLAAALEAAQKEVAVAAPYADKTDAIAAAYAALDAKVRDYFMRAKLTQFSAESTAALDVQVSRIEAISADNLTDKVTDIASYPIARIKEGQLSLPLDAAINPAWAAQFATVREALDAKATELTEAAWDEIGAKLKAFADYQKSISITEADIVLDDEAAAVQQVDKLLHLTRDFFTLLHNYVTLQDLYNTTKLAVFQSGHLIVDQRQLDLCVSVGDPGAMAAQAAKSGLFLLTCDCISKSTGKSLKIIAAVTKGKTGDLFVGKNCIFYDRNGVDYDAKIVGIAENPISIWQAFWTPYRKIGNFFSEKINKFASDKSSSTDADMTKTLEEKTTAATSTDLKDKAAVADAGKQAGTFDIAKFAGIFAAIGMAFAMVAATLAAIVGGFLALPWWKMILVILAIMLVISLPSMYLAWLKLRRRNLAPVLNANGWAVNASAKINIPFGNTLTQAVKLPVKVDVADPFPEKHTVRNWTITILAILLAAIITDLCTGRTYSTRIKQAVGIETPADTLVVEAPEVEPEVAPVVVEEPVAEESVEGEE